MEYLLKFFFYLWYDFIGYASCHQLPERTLVFGDHYLFVCCRCSAIYIGYVISYLFIYLTGRSRAREFPSKNILITGIILSSLMFLDVFSVILHFRAGSNEARLITGLLAGASLPFVVFPVLNRLLLNYSEEGRIIKGLTDYIIIILINIIMFFLLHSLYVNLFWPIFTIVSLGLILLYINLNSVFILLFFKFTGFFEDLHIWKVNFLSLIISFFEILFVFILYKVFGIK